MAEAPRDCRARRAAALAAAALSLSVGVASCGADGPEATRAEIKRVVHAVVDDPSERVGGTWVPFEGEWRGPGPWIARRCGSPVAGLGLPEEGLVSRAETAVLAAPLQPDSYVRIAVVGYLDETSADSAESNVGVDALEECVVEAINEYLAGRGISDVAYADASSIRTTGGPVPGSEHSVLIESTFEEEVLGGYDNTRNVDAFVGRTGPVVVATLVAMGGQGLSAEPTAQLTRELGLAALERAAGSLTGAA